MIKVLVLECIQSQRKQWLMVSGRELEEKDIYISSATIGRILTSGKNGMRSEEGSKGRTITKRE